MAQPSPPTEEPYFALAIHLWGGFRDWIASNPSKFDQRVNELERKLQCYTLELQRSQSMPERIQHASYFVSQVMILEHELLWGTHGYNDMINRLIAKRPFQTLEDTMQYFILPVRYCAVMELKVHTAHIQNAIRLTHESHRAALEQVAGGSEIARWRNYQYHLNAQDQDPPRARHPIVQSEFEQPQGTQEREQEGRWRVYQTQPDLRQHHGRAWETYQDYRNIETSASALVQASVDLGQHFAGNLRTIIQSFRRDIEVHYQRAQALHEAVRREQMRRLQNFEEQSGWTPSAASHSHSTQEQPSSIPLVGGQIALNPNSAIPITAERRHAHNRQYLSEEFPQGQNPLSQTQPVQSNPLAVPHSGLAFQEPDERLDVPCVHEQAPRSRLNSQGWPVEDDIWGEEDMHDS